MNDIQTKDAILKVYLYSPNKNRDGVDFHGSYLEVGDPCFQDFFLGFFVTKGHLTIYAQPKSGVDKNPIIISRVQDVDAKDPLRVKSDLFIKVRELASSDDNDVSPNPKVAQAFLDEIKQKAA
jgi:hypothetical protein